MTLSLRLNIKNNEGSLNNLYSFSCTPCYLVHYRASKRFDFHDHVSYHRKVSIDNSTLLSSAPFHWTTKQHVDLPTLYWVEVSHLRSLDKFKWNWYGILPTLTSMFALITNMFYSPYITPEGLFSLMIIVHIWMFININSLAFAQHGSLIINLGIMNWVFWDLHYIKYKNVVLHVS